MWYFLVRAITAIEKKYIKAYVLYRSQVENNTCAYNTTTEYQQMVVYTLAQAGLISSMKCKYDEARSIFRKAFDTVTQDSVLFNISVQYLNILKLEQQYVLFKYNYGEQNEYAVHLASELRKKKETSPAYQIVHARQGTEIETDNFI